jgi:hypothetical protein
MPAGFLQVTIGAGSTQVSTTSIPCRQIIVQNNGATNAERVGSDATVSTSKGLGLNKGGGSFTFGPFRDCLLDLNQIWVAGTQNDVLDVWYSY